MSELEDGPQYDLYRSLRLQGRSHDAAATTLAHLDVAVVEQLRAVYDSRRMRIFELSEPGFAAEGYHGPTDYDGPVPQDTYWPRVRQRLVSKGLGGALPGIEAATDRTLSFLPNPQSAESIGTRGLVLGYVQSGKTTNFEALIAKAADYGYRVIVVLAGVHNSLRQQTQDRLESDIIGLPELESHWWCPTRTGDFHTVDTNPGYFFNDPAKRALLVVKKNVAPLSKLNRWLDKTPDALLDEVSVLVIDDEADQAGLNVAPSGELSGVHEQVVRLLDFGSERGRSRVAYVGYTATPFANLLVEPDNHRDLYPRDFVVDLPEPKGYFGAESLFGREALDEDEEPVEGLPVIRSVPQTDVDVLMPPKDPDLLAEWRPPVPDTLRRAIRWFVLATAARRAIDKEARNSTMLVHTSSRIAAQCALQQPVLEVLSELRSELQADTHDFEALYDQELWRLPASTVNETAVAWPAVSERISAVVDDVIVRVDNSGGCSERLSYPEGKPQTVIAIGGNTLSRGLTLEGLVTSYFVRTASAYDTLLQMGRWFGFRPGYGHLQRIWMTDELRSWFADLSTVEQEIRRDIARFEDDHKTPEEIAVRIRTHPQMMITSAAKMRGAIDVVLAFGDSRIQTTRFQTDDGQWLDHNLSATRRLVTESVRQGSEPEGRRGRRLLRDVPHHEAMRFLGSYRAHPQDYSVNLTGLAEHVQREVSAGGADSISWNLVILGNKASEVAVDLGLGESSPTFVRRKLNLPDLDHAYIKALMSRSDHRIDMGGRPPTGGATHRARGEPAVIIVYPLNPQTGQGSDDPEANRVPLDAVRPVIGLAVSMPASVRSTSQQGQVYKTVDLSAQVVEESDDFGDEE